MSLSSCSGPIRSLGRLHSLSAAVLASPTPPVARQHTRPPAGRSANLAAAPPPATVPVRSPAARGPAVIQSTQGGLRVAANKPLEASRRGAPAAAATPGAAGAASMVQVVESERVSSREGHKLFTVAVLPDPGQQPVAVLCWHHGVGEHVGRYKSIFQRLAEAGIAVYSGDCVGHGKSEGLRAYVESYNEMVDEFLSLCDFAAADVRSRYPDAPPPPQFIAGHSLGGLVAALVCHRDQGRWAGLMVCSPALDVKMGPVLKIQAALGGLLAMLIPKARMVPGVDPVHMNPDPKLVGEYINDPLNTVGALPMRTGNEILKGMRWLRARWPEFRLPIYLHHGEGDQCTSPIASKAFAEAVSSTDKTVNIVPGGFHEVLLSPGVADELTNNMIEWIKSHAAAVVAAGEGGSGSAAAAAKM